MKLLFTVLIMLAGCHSDPPAPEVTRPAVIHGRVFAIAALDGKRAAVAHAETKDGPVELSLWNGSGIAWSLTLPCTRDDLRPDQKAGTIGRRFVALAAGPDVVAVYCTERDSRQVRMTAFRTADGGRAWLGDPRDVDPNYMSELHAMRVGQTIVAYDNRTFIAYAAATGNVLLSRDDLQTAPARWPTGLLTLETWNATELRMVTMFDGTSGTVRFRTPGTIQCTLPDGLVVIHDNDYERFDFAGKATPLAAHDPLTQAHTVACSPRGEHMVLGLDVDAGARIADATTNRSVLIPHAGAGAFLRGWERALPRYLAASTHNDQIAIVDLDEMRLDRMLRFDLPGEQVAPFAPRIVGRIGDLWLGDSPFGLFGVDGSTGRIVALRGATLAYTYWLDFQQMLEEPAFLVAREDGAGALSFGPVDLGAEAKLAGLLEAHARSTEP
jgi:hypothetical protein